MIRVLSVSFGEYTKVTYMKHNGRCDETYQLKTKDLYRPEMIRQYDKMKELFLQWFPTFKFSANMYYMVGMGIKYNKHDDTLIDKVKVTGGLENKAGSLCKVVSEWLPVGTEEHKEEIRNLIESKIGKKLDIDVRQVEEGRRFEDSFVDIEKLINMDIVVEDD